MRTHRLWFVALTLFATLGFLGCGGTVVPELPPATSSYPDETNTGTHGTLAAYTGATRFDEDNAVIENVEIRVDTPLYVNAKNITFRNVRFIYTGTLDGTFTMVNTSVNAINLQFQDCELNGQDKVSRAISGSASDMLVQRCNIHHTGNGVEVHDRFRIENSYIHDIAAPDGTSWHADGIQAGTGALKDIVIKHNTIFLTGNQTGCIFISGGKDPETASIENVLIEDNLMGGGGYSMYTGTSGSISNYKVINNKFTTRFHPKVGTYNIWYPSFTKFPTISGNTIFETGASADTNL